MYYMLSIWILLVVYLVGYVCVRVCFGGGLRFFFLGAG